MYITLPPSTNSYLSSLPLTYLNLSCYSVSLYIIRVSGEVEEEEAEGRWSRKRPDRKRRDDTHHFYRHKVCLCIP